LQLTIQKKRKPVPRGGARPGMDGNRWRGGKKEEIRLGRRQGRTWGALIRSDGAALAGFL
jgi:hypothetical protein